MLHRGRIAAMAAGLFCFIFAATPPAFGQSDYPRLPPTNNIEKMRKGDMAVEDDKRNQEYLEQYAQWFARRLVHPPFNGLEPTKRNTGIPENIETLMADTERSVTWPNPRQPPNENQVKYAKAYGKALAYEIMDVYEKSDKKLEKVNAARMLAIVGKLPYPDVADLYLKIIRDDKYPLEIKLFAFEGLRNSLAVALPTDADLPQFNLRDPVKLAEIATELEKFILRKHPGTLPADEARLYRFIRREAVRALAEVRYSVIRKQGVIIDKPIWALLRVATNDKIVKAGDAAMPGYGFDMLERIAAVIGICSMVPDKDLNMDVVAYLVDDALVDIGTFHAKERSEFQNDPRHKPLVPWRISGVYLTDAFNTWKKSLSGTRKYNGGAEAIKLAERATENKCLPKLEADGVMAQADFRAFDDWKRNNKPKSNQVMADDPATTVELK